MTTAVQLPDLRFTRPTRPGLFVTGTGTEVGKTVATCVIAAAIRAQRGARVGVFKPLASGCRKERGQLISEDAEALAHFADCRLPLDVINPIRYRTPVAPAVAAEIESMPPDWSAFNHSLQRLDDAHDCLLVEGVGGLRVPLDPARAGLTVVELIALLGYPVLVVAKPGLGTLNHTALTLEALVRAEANIAGVLINGFDGAIAEEDPSVTSNRHWIQRMTGFPVIGALPRCPEDTVRPHEGILHPNLLDAALGVDWMALMGRSVANV